MEASNQTVCHIGGAYPGVGRCSVFELVVRRRTPQAGTPEAVVQTSAEADEDTVQTAARQPGNKRGGGTHDRPGSV